MNLILFRGVKRSGNHLIINWILSHHSNVFFWNNCCPKDFKTVSEVRDAANSQDDEDVVIFSFEFPQLISEHDFSQVIFCNKYKHVLTPMLIRDPYNWMSSFLYNDNISNKEVELDYRKNHSRYWNIWTECFDIWADSTLRVDFNKFVSNQNYRKELADEMLFNFCPKIDKQVLNILWNHKEISLPSSFDTDLVKSYEIEPKEMKVLDRHKKISHLFDKYGICPEVIARAKDYWSM